MRVTGLFVYPLKSARGLPLVEARLDDFGIVGDRRWSLLGSDGRVITQRDCPVLATLDAALTDVGIELRAPGRPTLRVVRPTQESGCLPIQIWKDRTSWSPAPRLSRRTVGHGFGPGIHLSGSQSRVRAAQ